MSGHGRGCCMGCCRPSCDKIYQGKGSTLFDSFALLGSIMTDFAYHKSTEQNAVVYDNLWCTNSCLDRGR